MNTNTLLRTTRQMQAEAMRCAIAARRLSQSLRHPYNGRITNYMIENGLDEHLSNLEQVQQWADKLSNDLDKAAADITYAARRA